MGIMPIPVLSKIPVIGSIFFQQSPLVYGAYLLVAVTAVFLNRTKAGLNFKAVGEFPKAAETLGINVVLQKYIACIICGALAGIGGAYLTIYYTSTYSEGIVAGPRIYCLISSYLWTVDANRSYVCMSAFWLL